MASCTGRLVAANTRTSTEISLDPPSRRTLPSCNTRSNFACIGIGISPISSSNRVPWSACSKQPGAPSESTGEGSFFMAEQLALNQRLRQRGAVDG